MPDLSADIAGYRFGDVEIDLRRRELRVDGDVAAVEPRVYELIAVLVVGRDRAFGKDELIARLWKRPVTDASLSQLVYKARRAMGEDGARRYIETVHGHGFRWVAPVEPLRGSPDRSAPPGRADGASATALRVPLVTTPRRRPRLWAALGLLLIGALTLAWVAQRQMATAGSSERRVLVLPVDDRTGEAELAWMRRGAMGVVASVIEQRPGVFGLQATDSTTDTRALEDPAQRRHLRDRMGADAVVVLSLARVGTLLRLDVALESPLGRREDALFGADAAMLALDAGRRIGTWLGTDDVAQSATLTGLDGYLAETYARGIEAYIDGRLEEARSYFSICAERRPELVWPRLQLATTLLRIGRTNEALRILVGIEASATVLAPVQARHVRLRIAAARLANGDLAAASAGFDAVRTQAEEAGDAMSLRIASEGLGQVALTAGDHAGAAAWLQKVVDMDRRRDDHRREAQSLANLASVALHRGDLVAAREQYQRVADLARAFDLPALRLCSLQALAMIQQAQGDLASAQAMHVLSARLARDAGDLRSETVAHTGMAKVFAGYGRAEPAQRHAQRALELAAGAGMTTEHAFALAAAGQAARAAGDATTALRLQTESAEAFREMGSWSVLAGQAFWLAREARARGDRASLARWAAEGEAIAHAQRNAIGVTLFVSAIRAQQQAAGGDSAGALATLDAALRESRAMQDALRGRVLALELGRIALDAGLLGRTADVLADLDVARSEDPYAIRLHIDWLAASGRDAEAEAERARLARLADALEDTHALVNAPLESDGYDAS